MAERMQTHWEGCENDPRHHACALARLAKVTAERDAAIDGHAESHGALSARIDTLTAENERLRAALLSAQERNQDACRQMHAMKDGSFYSGVYQGHENARQIIASEIAALDPARAEPAGECSCPNEHWQDTPTDGRCPICRKVVPYASA